MTRESRIGSEPNMNERRRNETRGWDPGRNEADPPAGAAHPFTQSADVRSRKVDGIAATFVSPGTTAWVSSQ